MCIEINHVEGGTKAVIRLLENHGYTFLGQKDIDAWFGLRELLQENIDVDYYLKTKRVGLQRRKILRENTHLKH